MNWYWKKCNKCWVTIWKNSRTLLCTKHYHQSIRWYEDQKLKSMPNIPVWFEFVSEKERICIENKYLGKTYKEIWCIFIPAISKQAVLQIIQWAERRYLLSIK